MSISTTSPDPTVASVADLRAEFEAVLERLGNARPDVVSVDVQEADDGLRIVLTESRDVDPEEYAPGARPIERWISTVLNAGVVLERAATRLVPGSGGRKAIVYVPAETNLEGVADA